MSNKKKAGRPVREVPTHKITITVTEKEYDILKRASAMDGKPIATAFVETARELFVFQFLGKCVQIAESLISVREKFKKKSKEAFNDISTSENK
ncbi:hypothetical protein [Pseudomonas aeruginosa]|uniref:hypothetical protein n=1 Tax=Pseudomonas aeruginosa TaxID=287 RepID=UPI0011C3E1C4|nr:hypothetical protein [Pseudomonas aeruginosa]